MSIENWLLVLSFYMITETYQKKKGLRLKLIVDPVIQAIGRPDFEDVLRTGALGRSFSDHPSVRTNPEVNLARPMG